MAKNFFKQLEELKKKYTGYSDKNKKRVEKIAKSITDYLIKVEKWLESYNAYIKETKSKYDGYTSSFLSEINSDKKAMVNAFEKVDDFYKSNLKNKSFADIVLTQEQTAKIVEIFKNIDEKRKKVFEDAVKCLTNDEGDIEFDNDKIMVADAKNFLLGWPDKNKNYKLSVNDNEIEIISEGKTIGINSLKYTDSEGNIKEADTNWNYKDYKDNFNFEYDLNGKYSGENINAININTEKDLSKILIFYNFLVYCKSLEVKRWKELYTYIYNKEGFFDKIKNYIEIKQKNLKEFKQKIKLSNNNQTDEKNLINDLMDDFIKLYLWGTTESSLSKLDEQNIKGFISGVQVENVKSYLQDNTSKKAKEVAEVFNFCKEFIEQLENYDTKKNFKDIVDTVDENTLLNLKNVDTTNDLKRKLNNNYKPKESNKDSSYLVKAKTENNETGNNSLIEIAVSNQASATNALTIGYIYEDEDKNLFSVNNVLTAVDKEFKKSYYKISNDSKTTNSSEVVSSLETNDNDVSNIYPYGLYLNCNGDKETLQKLYYLLNIIKNNDSNDFNLTSGNGLSEEPKEAIKNMCGNIENTVEGNISGKNLLNYIDINDKEKTYVNEVIGLIELYYNSNIDIDTDSSLNTIEKNQKEYNDSITEYSNSYDNLSKELQTLVEEEIEVI